MSQSLVLKRGSTNRPSGQWADDDYDVVSEGRTAGRIYRSHAMPADRQWFWGLAYGEDKDRSPTHGYAGSREEAMAAFRKSWDRGAS